MKSIFRLYISVILSVLLLSTASCTKDKTPFTGLDADIYEFSLTVDGVKYPASITNNTILITVPTDISLSNATVEFVASENSTIVPNPYEIDNWNSERVFYLQGWKGKTIKTYTFLINRTDVVQEGNITLETQSDLEAFAATKSNVVKGNLILGSANASSDDPITNTESLSSITSVAYNVVIKSGFAAESLEGLRNLEKAGGIYVGTQTSAVTTQQDFAIDLPKLTSVSNVVINSNNVTSLSIGKLTSAAILYLNSSKLSELDLHSFTETVGDLTLTNLTLKELELPALSNVGGICTLSNLVLCEKMNLPKFSKVASNLDISGMNALSSLDFPKLQSVGGALTQKTCNNLKEFSFESLEEVGSISFVYTNAAKIKKANFSKLKRVNDGLALTYYIGTELSFPQLEKIGGLLSFSYLQYLEKCDLPLLKELGSITLSNVGSLASLDLSKVQGVQNMTLGGLTMLNLIAPKEISGNVVMSGYFPTSFTGLEIIGGNLTANTTSIYIEYPSIKQIKGTFSLTSAANIETFSMAALEQVGTLNVNGTFAKCESFAMPKLKKVDTNFNMRGMLIAELDFKSLQTVGGSFTYYGGPYASYASRSTITSMNAFSSIQSAERVEIRYASKLSDFSAFKDVVKNLSSSNWIVSNCAYNPTYQDMIDGNYSK